MFHFSHHGSALSLPPGLYFFSSPPAWQWGAVPRLSALNHRDRLELGCPKMVAFTSQKHNWKSHFDCKGEAFSASPFYQPRFSFSCSRKWLPELRGTHYGYLCWGVVFSLYCLSLKWLGRNLFSSLHGKRGRDSASEIQSQINLILPRFKLTEFSLLAGWESIFFSGYYTY